MQGAGGQSLTDIPNKMEAQTAPPDALKQGDSALSSVCGGTTSVVAKRLKDDNTLPATKTVEDDNNILPSNGPSRVGVILEQQEDHVERSVSPRSSENSKELAKTAQSDRNNWDLGFKQGPHQRLANDHVPTQRIILELGPHDVLVGHMNDARRRQWP